MTSPLRPRRRQEQGIAAASRLAHRGTPYGASLSFATTTHLWPLSDPPSRKSRSATSRTGTARSIPGRALASSMLDSPCQGSRSGLTPPISTSVPSTLAPLAYGSLREKPPTPQPSSGPVFNRREHLGWDTFQPAKPGHFSTGIDRRGSRRGMRAGPSGATSSDGEEKYSARFRDGCDGPFVAPLPGGRARLFDGCARNAA